jgi:hypothetical protein
MLQPNNASAEKQMGQTIIWPGSPFGVVRGFTDGYGGMGADVFLQQLEPSDEAWIMLGTSSLWATRRAVQLLPPSPACNLERYARFVSLLVDHCQGRLRYWHRDNEP